MQDAEKSGSRRGCKGRDSRLKTHQKRLEPPRVEKEPSSRRGKGQCTKPDKDNLALAAWQPGRASCSGR